MLCGVPISTISQPRIGRLYKAMQASAALSVLFLWNVLVCCVAGTMFDFGLAGVRVIFSGDGCAVRRLMHFCPPV